MIGDGRLSPARRAWRRRPSFPARRNRSRASSDDDGAMTSEPRSPAITSEQRATAPNRSPNNGDVLCSVSCPSEFQSRFWGGGEECRQTESVDKGES
ncbi:unnamed protein product [Linum trigynum]|uniref:Uncharacterized protein n=1 Tax=Linum trigynum TaxID=586398 RepID=A0AAV2GEE2_9ROSI